MVKFHCKSYSTSALKGSFLKCAGLQFAFNERSDIVGVVVVVFVVVVLLLLFCCVVVNVFVGADLHVHYLQHFFFTS